VHSVSEAKADWYFRPEARQAYEALSRIDQVAVDRLIDFLCADPEPDDHWKFSIDDEDPPGAVYFDDGHWGIAYFLVNDRWVLEIWGLTAIDR
jgi:hypothetical protein